MQRCSWANTSKILIDYHDQEWGVPVFNDHKHFEFLILESAQAGINWLTILKKRDNYRLAYNNFDPQQVALFDETKKIELLSNSGLIRNKLKINASITNAKHFLTIQKEFGSFSTYIWSFTNGKPIVGHWENIADIPSKTELSDKISLDMKKRGFGFLGSIIMIHICKRQV